MKKLRIPLCFILAFILIFTLMPITAAQAGLLSTATKMIGGRVTKELSAYSISNDIPVLGDVFYFFCDPGQRAELAHKAVVKDIYKTVNEIKTAIEALNGELDNLKNIIETNHAEDIFYSAKQKIDSISDKYTVAQQKYENAIKAISDYAEAEEDKKASYEIIAQTAMEDFVDAIDSNILINFENDLANLNNSIIKSGDNTT